MQGIWRPMFECHTARPTRSHVFILKYYMQMTLLNVIDYSCCFQHSPLFTQGSPLFFLPPFLPSFFLPLNCPQLPIPLFHWLPVLLHSYQLRIILEEQDKPPVSISPISFSVQMRQWDFGKKKKSILVCVCISTYSLDQLRVSVHKI